MIPTALCINSHLGRYVAALRVTDANGLGTDETLSCETPIRTSRRAALDDAWRKLGEMMAENAAD